jgi:HSP20 family protein
MSSALLRHSNANQLHRSTIMTSTADQALSDILGFDPLGRFFSHVNPEISVSRTEQGYEVEMPVPGFKPENVEITLKSITANEQVITISGKSERRAFTRSIRLPEDIDADRIEAQVESGLLTLTLSRYPEAQPRKIPINAKANDG